MGNGIKILAKIMIFIGSVFFIFGLTYLIGWIIMPVNPFLMAWVMESIGLTLLIFSLICDGIS